LELVERKLVEAEIEWLVDLVLFPISLFSGKTLAVSIALLVLGTAIGIWIFIHTAFECPFDNQFRSCGDSLLGKML
jgi:hypothetical protein